MNWADFDADIEWMNECWYWYNNFWLDWYPTLWLLNAGCPLQMYFLLIMFCSALDVFFTFSQRNVTMNPANIY